MRCFDWIIWIVLLFLGLCYIFNSPVLQLIYPKVSQDYQEYIDFIAARNRVYEIMFTMCFWLVFLTTRGRPFIRATSTFFMVLAAGSFMDKALFNITSYVISDFILILVGLLISYKVYAGENKITEQ